MIACINCGVSATKKPLLRTGAIKAAPGWMCQDCIKKKHPQMFAELKKDGELKLINDLFECVQKFEHFIWGQNNSSKQKNV